MKRVLTGIQPSGVLHIGNYFGAIRNTIELSQKMDESIVFIADLHSLTVNPDPDDLRRRVRGVAVDFIACGLDPEKTIFFRQSDVPIVCELTWILNCVTSLGLLERAHSYKDKVAKGFVPNNGLFSYPVLMAADILLYHSHVVPVGKDQKQHLEITRDLAIRFNQMYGEVFTIPEPYISENVAVVPGTDGQKMSKSYNNTIEIFGDPKAVKKKIMSIQTDSKGLEEPKDPEACNVFALYKLFANKESQDELAAKYRAGNFGYGHAKLALYDAYMDFFAPMRKRREELLADPGYVDSVLRKGAEQARERAEATMNAVRKAVGLC